MIPTVIFSISNEYKLREKRIIIPAEESGKMPNLSSHTIYKGL